MAGKACSKQLEQEAARLHAFLQGNREAESELEVGCGCTSQRSPLVRYFLHQGSLITSSNSASYGGTKCSKPMALSLAKLPQA